MSCLFSNRSRGATWLLTALALLWFPAPLLADTMADRREKTDYFIEFTPFGFHEATLFAPPFGVGLHLGQEWMVGVEYGAGHRESGIAAKDPDASSIINWFNPPCAVSEIRDSTFTNWGAFFRYIPTRTLFLGAAVHQRTWSGTARVDYADKCVGGNHDATGHLETQALIASFMLGNTWQFGSGFTITGTWLVVSPLLSSSTSFSLDSGQGLSASQAHAAKEEGKRLGEGLNTRASASGLALLTLGWAF